MIKIRCMDLSMFLWEEMIVTQLLNKIGVVMGANESSKTMKCEAFDDDNCVFELVNLPKIRPRTRHVANKCHYFSHFS